MSDYDRDDELSFKADEVVTPDPVYTGEEVREQDPAEIQSNAIDNSHVDTAAERDAE